MADQYYRNQQPPYTPYNFKDDVGEEFHKTVIAATELRMWIHRQAGPGSEYFLRFFRPFSNLYELTCDIEEIKSRLSKEDKAERIMFEKWFEKSLNLNDKKELIPHMNNGLELFRNYKKILSDGKVLKL